MVRGDAPQDGINLVRTRNIGVPFHKGFDLDAEPFGLGDTDGGEGDADTEAQNQEQGRDIAIERTFDRGIGRRERHDK